jgi:hypothetical protein
MTVHSSRLLFWAPRLLTVAYAIFLSLFALDVFNEKLSVGKLLLALLIHLTPVAIILLVLAFAWRWEWVGTVIFAGLGIFYWVRAVRHPNWVVLISGPLFLLAALFLVSWMQRGKFHNRLKNFEQ